MFKTGVFPSKDPGVFRSLLLPEAADMLAAGEPLTALGLTEEQVATGALAGYLEDGWFQMISFYVAPAYRRRGGGRLLLETLSRLLEDEQAGIRIDFTVTRPEHRDLAAFLEAEGFENETGEDENIYLISVEDLKRVPFFAKAASPGKIRVFAELEENLLYKADREARESGAPIPEGGLCGPEVERNISAAVVKDRRMIAYVAFDRSCMGKLTLAAAWSERGGPMTLPLILRESFARIEKTCPQGDVIAMQAVNDASAALIHALAPTAEPISRTYMKKGGFRYA